MALQRDSSNNLPALYDTFKDNYTFKWTYSEQYNQAEKHTIGQAIP